MHKLDEIRQKERPTIMMPKHGELEPCPMRKTRFLMARDGLFIETQQSFGRLVKQLWQSPRPLPYGVVEEVDEFWPVLTACFDHIIGPEMFHDAAEYARSNREWCGYILCDEGDSSAFYYHKNDFDSTVGSLYYRRSLPKGSSLVVDVHSHGEIPPFFSSTDDEDDRGGVRICVVLGSFKEKGDVRDFHWAARYVIEGFFFELDAELVGKALNLEGEDEALSA